MIRSSVSTVMYEVRQSSLKHPEREASFCTEHVSIPRGPQTYTPSASFPYGRIRRCADIYLR